MSLTQKVKTFCTSQKNAPNVALSLTAECIAQAINNQNSSPLAILVKNAPKGMPIRHVIGVCVDGIKIDTTSKKAKAHPNKCIVSMEEAKTTKLHDVLVGLVAENESIKGTRVKEELLGITPPVADFDKYVKTVLAKLTKEGWDTDKFTAKMSEVV